MKIRLGNANCSDDVSALKPSFCSVTKLIQPFTWQWITGCYQNLKQKLSNDNHTSYQSKKYDNNRKLDCFPSYFHSCNCYIIIFKTNMSYKIKLVTLSTNYLLFRYNPKYLFTICGGHMNNNASPDKKGEIESGTSRLWNGNIGNRQFPIVPWSVENHRGSTPWLRHSTKADR